MSPPQSLRIVIVAPDSLVGGATELQGEGEAERFFLSVPIPLHSCILRNAIEVL